MRVLLGIWGGLVMAQYGANVFLVYKKLVVSVIDTSM